MKSPGTLPRLSMSSLLLLFYQIEGNYYANYFSMEVVGAVWVSGFFGRAGS